MNNKIRVLHLLASNIFSGAENVASTIIKEFNNNYEMLYCSPRGSIEETLKERGIHYYGIKKLSLKELKKVVEDFKPDIIHAHDFKATFYASFFRDKCQIISHIHKNDPLMKKVTIKSLIYRFCSGKVETILGASESILDEYIFKNTIKEKYITLYNYIDKANIIRLSEEFTIDNKFDLFYLGRLSHEKNPVGFIKIVKELNEPEIRCVMIGDGPLMNMCNKLIEKYNLKKNIEVLGFKQNPFPYLKNSRIGIMPSKYEGFGITAIESIILDRPILNSGVGGLKNIFSNNPEYICNSYEEYINKIKNFKRQEYSKVDIGNYTDLIKWKKILEKTYGGEESDKEK